MNDHNLVEILGASLWILRLFDDSCMDSVSYLSSLMLILGSYQFTFQKGFTFPHHKHLFAILLFFLGCLDMLCYGVLPNEVFGCATFHFEQ